jgi:uncharacterized protein YcfJ
MRTIARLVVGTLIVLLLAACGHYHMSRQEERRVTGQVVGGLTGAAVGSLFGRGGGRVAATGAGAILGAIIGGRVADR